MGWFLCPYDSTREPLDGFGLNLVGIDFMP
jgi:hypothetical protein